MTRRRFLLSSVWASAAKLLRRVDRMIPNYVAPAPFSVTSEWNKPLPADAPIDPASDDWIATLLAFSPTIKGPRFSTGWAIPFYVGTSTDPLVKPKKSGVVIKDGKGNTISVHIPVGATPSAKSDHMILFFDEPGQFWLGLHGAVAGSWTCDGFDIYYQGSNGLCGSLVESDDKRNTGHRGYPSAIAPILGAELDALRIPHVIKVSIDNTAPQHVYPGCGHEARTGTVPEGAILRIKPSVDVNTLTTNPMVLAVLEAMQTYGVVIGDTGDVPMAMKLQLGETRGLKDGDLSVSFNDMEGIQQGYHRP